ncbi:class I SAM-dependent methyltransferase [Endozoicomonas sp.]|uniref:class I SAM-dependent methyltransferase n=1 Tax=Endozoicomonas sp. TaxID=1892382 RepID=UPI002888F6CB|nr:class I SAM-dependent methyltransferase [Endozoicomonas sp.]
MTYPAGRDAPLNTANSNGLKKSEHQSDEELTACWQGQSLSKNINDPLVQSSTATNKKGSAPDLSHRTPVRERPCCKTSPDIARHNPENKAGIAGVGVAASIPPSSSIISLQDYLKTRDTSYQVQQQKHIVFIGRSTKLKLSLPPSLSKLYSPKGHDLVTPDDDRCAAFLLTAAEANNWSPEQLTALAKKAFNTSADIIFSGEPATSVKEIITNADYNELPGSGHSSGSAFFQPVSIRTTNQFGTQLALDAPKRDFIEQAKQPGTKSLDIGGGFGAVVLCAAQEGAKNIHLWEVNREVVTKFDNIILNEGFKGCIHAQENNLKTNEITPEEEESFDVILISRVLHLFRPDEIESAAIKLYRLLKPGGVLHITGETAFLQVAENYIPTYLKKIENEELWPGFLNEEAMKTFFEPARAKNHHGIFTFLDLCSPATIFKKAGFTVLHNEYLSRISGVGRHEDRVLLKKGSKFEEHRGKESVWLKLKKPLQNA